MLKNKRQRKRFYKSFVFTLIGGLLIVGCTLLVLRVLVRQPAIPAYSAQPFMPVPTFRPRESAFDIAEPHSDDALINIQPPDNGWERKPDFFTLLIFGYDAGMNTDTIMVAAFDAAAREAYIVSIPRDTRVDVRRNIARINSAFPVGRMNGGGHEGGVDQLQRELQTLIGFRPDFYVSIEEDAFRRIVDAVGGVSIDVEFHMLYTDPYQGLRIDIPAGQQRLNGENALHFVRYRHGNDPRRTISDYQRMQNQQRLINAMVQELLSPRTILRVPELIRTYREHVRTDLDIFEMLWFAEQLLREDVALHMYNYPTESVLRTHWYEMPKAEEALALINRTVNPFTQDLTINNLQLAR
jgi:LCP family protein required for cell wall assembly